MSGLRRSPVWMHTRSSSLLGYTAFEFQPTLPISRLTNLPTPDLPFVASTNNPFSRRQVPIYALLLFGGPVAVNHVGGGLTIGRRDAYVKLKAWPRIGVLVNQLRCVGNSTAEPVFPHST